MERREPGQDGADPAVVVDDGVPRRGRPVEERHAYRDPIVVVVAAFDVVRKRHAQAAILDQGGGHVLVEVGFDHVARRLALVSRVAPLSRRRRHALDNETETTITSWFSSFRYVDRYLVYVPHPGPQTTEGFELDVGFGYHRRRRRRGGGGAGG